MVTFVIVLWAIGMLIMPLGRVYKALQVNRGNPKFSDPEFIRKYDAIRRISALVITGIAIIILLLLSKL